MSDSKTVKKKSLEINMILNAIKGIMRIIFPLITFPYVSKVLGVEGVGKYNFASSMVGYFIMFAGLGISTYAIREGAKIRENKQKSNQFISEIFSINLFSTLISYLLLAVLLCVWPVLQNYTILILILSIQIGFTTIGVEWIYSIFEDYAYITVRSIIFQIFSLVMLFILVHKPDDLYWYAFITAFSGVGSNLLNLIHSKKYCHIKVTCKIDWKKHLIPIFILFATTVTVRIYSNSDVTILGILCGDYEVGLYSVSTKVYEVIKTILSSVIIVSIPRLASLAGKRDGSFSKLAESVYMLLISLVMPCLTGIILLRKEIVWIVSDESYIQATTSLTILSIALLFSLFGWFWGQCILVPHNKEKIVFVASAVSAVVNIAMNFLLIPIWKQDAAAFTTLIAECLQFLLCWFAGRKYLSKNKILSCCWKSLIGCMLIIILNIWIINNNWGTVMHCLLLIPLSIFAYSLVELLLQNPGIVNIFNKFLRKTRKI